MELDKPSLTQRGPADSRDGGPRSRRPAGLRPLAEGNRLQRAYARWAAPYYARMKPGLRQEAELVDRWLYSRHAWGLWLGLAASLLATTAGLASAGLPLWVAVLCSAAVWVSLPVGLFAAWMQPEKFTGRRLVRGAIGSLGLAYLGLACGFLFGRWQRHGSLQTDNLLQALRDAAVTATPVVLVLLTLLLALTWGVAQIRRQTSERELEALRLEQERDSAARQAAEAQLRLLQAQIQPHFIFNTLATVQHWVDTADPRAGPLLRALSTFLRGSTELLAREQATLAEEAALAGHYLDILQARLGSRLQVAMEIDPAVAGQALPPGLLLTLVENAVEHGISPALAGGTVRVQAGPTATGWRLCVSDDGAGLPAHWQEGTGLANCRQRLAHRFGSQARLSLQPLQPAGTRACIEVQAAHRAEGSP
jgi:signal transduction histidine kinase